MSKIIGFAIAGAIGTLCRFGCSSLLQRLPWGNFPGGTAIVNITGCFLYGLVWSLGAQRAVISPDMRAILLTGFMGAYTTFSTFIFETNGLADQGALRLGLLNLLIQVTLGWLAVNAGLKLGAWTP